MTTRFEKAMAYVTFGVFTITLLAVLIAVLFACVHIVRDTPTKSDYADFTSDLKSDMVRIENLLLEMRQEMVDTRQRADSNIINHLSTAHVSNP